MICVNELDDVLVRSLPELASDRVEYDSRRAEDPEFTQTFFNYSFVPTLQAALDQGVQPFCNRAFELIEQLVTEGDPALLALVREEFFDYGPACEKWMKRALPLMGPQTRAIAESKNGSS